eukprot:7378971-Prymnesium_polylepis.2
MKGDCARMPLRPPARAQRHRVAERLHQLARVGGLDADPQLERAHLNLVAALGIAPRSCREVGRREEDPPDLWQLVGGQEGLVQDVEHQMWRAHILRLGLGPAWTQYVRPQAQCHEPEVPHPLGHAAVVDAARMGDTVLAKDGRIRSAWPVEAHRASIRRGGRAPLPEALLAVAAHRPAAARVGDHREVEPFLGVLQRSKEARPKSAAPFGHLSWRRNRREHAWRVRDQRRVRLVCRPQVGVFPRTLHAPPHKARPVARVAARLAAAVARAKHLLAVIDERRAKWRRRLRRVTNGKRVARRDDEAHALAVLPVDRLEVEDPEFGVAAASAEIGVREQRVRHADPGLAACLADCVEMRIQTQRQMARADRRRFAGRAADGRQAVQAAEPLRAAAPLLLLHDDHGVLLLREASRPLHQHELLEA